MVQQTPISVQNFPWGIAYDPVNKDIYVANAGSMSVSVISTLTNKVIDTITVKANPHGVAYDPANNEIYVANQGSGTVSVINAATNTVIKELFPGGGAGPENIAYDPANDNLYVTGGLNTIAIIDGSTNTVNEHLTVGSHPFGVAYDSTHKRMYITNSFSNDVSVVNATTNTVIGTTIIPVGSRPFDIAFNPSNNATYVTNSLSSTVSVVSTLDRGELDIAASAENTTAHSGNRQSHYIVASVTDDEDGQPVTGLIPNNFKVVTMVSPNGGVPIQVTDVTEGTLPGFYRINVVPPGNETWKSGDYIFSIAVVNEEAKGQILAHMSVR